MSRKIENAEWLQLFGEAPASGEAPAAEVTGDTTAPAAEETEDVEGDFAKLTSKGGKYAEAYQKQMQKAFDKRYKGFKETEAKAIRLDDFVKTVAMRYPNVDASDLDALEEAYMSDTRFHDKRAWETGEDAKALAEAEKKDLELRKLKAQNEAEKQRKKQAELTEQFRAKLAQQEKDLKKDFPDLDIVEEIKNPKMWEKLRRGEPLRDAYIAIHHDELLKAAVEGAKTAVVDSIARGNTRPKEGSSSASVPVQANTDFANLSKKDFMKIWNS